MGDRTVLVTGFEPFGEHKVNASWEAVKELAKIGISDSVNLVIGEIPVHYENVKKRIASLWEEAKPVLCIHVGVSGLAHSLQLEGFAHNHGYEREDNSGQTPQGGCCVEGGPDRLCSGVEVDRTCAEASFFMNEEISSSSLSPCEFETSQDAGRYLCDFSYYTSLHGYNAPVLFVHVPPLDNPYSCQQLALALKSIIRSCLQHL